jgi:hypothetical protein
MPPVEFEPAIAGERPQIDALDGAAAETGNVFVIG